MPFVFQDLTDAEAQEFCDAYVAEGPARLQAFIEALDIFPEIREALEAGEAGMPVVWEWFYSTYGLEGEPSPLADAGVEYEVPYWWTPIEWYRVGSEGVWVGSGIAVWLWSLLEERYGPLQLSPDPDERSASHRNPFVLNSEMRILDRVVEIDSRRLLEPGWESSVRRPEQLAERFEFNAAFHSVTYGKDDELATPEVEFDDDGVSDFGVDEVEIMLDLMTDEARQARFEVLLFASPLFSRSDWDGDRCQIIPKIQGTRAEVEAAVARFWNQSATE